MLEFCVLSSGSKANCIYLGTENVRILIDCGLSCRQAVERLKSVNIEPDTISAILVTHEHSDHISGIPVFARKYRTQVMLNQATFASAPALHDLQSNQIAFFETGKEFIIDELKFDPFSILHDAAEPVAFRIRDAESAIAVVTDLGQPTNLVQEKIRGVDALILESNHDLEMLWDAPYPWEIKQRIRGRLGHLSNEQAASIIELLSTDERASKLKHVVAAHVSEKSNTLTIALETLRRAWKWDGYEPIFHGSSPYAPGERVVMKA